jgi:hypothetical protein
MGRQSINLGTAPSLVVGGTGLVSATGGGSGNPVTFSSTTTGICTIAGSAVTGITAGICTIAANQAGNASYAAAAEVIENITVSESLAVTLDFAIGWNLVGNGSDAPINVANTFADTNRFVTVWKWIAAQNAWAFHAPTLAAQGGTALAEYLASKGYQTLTTIAGGEGFWVNAKQAGNVTLATGNKIGVAALGPSLIKGWNLISLGETATPKQFCDAQSSGVTTLWAWDTTASAWYFYAPSLDANGGLASYINSKGYLDFTTNSKTLGQGIGFWANRP